MVAARPVVGAIFIAVMLMSVVYAVAAPVLQPIRFPRLNLPWLGPEESDVVDRFSLFRSSNVSSTVKFASLNISLRFGVVDVVFSDQADLACEASLRRRSDAAELQTDYGESAEDQSLKIDLYGEAGALNLTFGRDYKYDGNLGVRIGAFIIDLGEHANVSRLGISVRYAGGVSLKIGNNTSFERLDFDINVGGLQLTAEADSLRTSGKINTDIGIGGYSIAIDVDTSKIGVSLNSTIDTGALTISHSDFDGEISAKSCSVATAEYGSAAYKLDIRATVGLGGGTLQKKGDLWITPAIEYP